jgi:fatty acid/phospholipid biosynthesis enzyme
MKILVDAMGGDNAPLCVLQGVSQAAAEFGDGMELVLLGVSHDGGKTASGLAGGQAQAGRVGMATW